MIYLFQKKNSYNKFEGKLSKKRGLRKKCSQKNADISKI